MELHRFNGESGASIWLKKCLRKHFKNREPLTHICYVNPNTVEWQTFIRKRQKKFVIAKLHAEWFFIISWPLDFEISSICLSQRKKYTPYTYTKRSSCLHKKMLMSLLRLVEYKQVHAKIDFLLLCFTRIPCIECSSSALRTELSKTNQSYWFYAALFFFHFEFLSTICVRILLNENCLAWTNCIECETFIHPQKCCHMSIMYCTLYSVQIA